MTSSVRTVAVILSAAVFAVFGSACGDGGGEKSEPSKSPGDSARAKTVSVRSGELGKFLAGGEEGKTLYLFVKDKTSKSTCSGSCAEAWPPMTVKDKPVAGSGVQKGLLGTTTGGDGGKQVTYQGHPLYYYQPDQKAGETKGQDLDQFGAKWYVVGTDGKAIKDKPKGDGGGGGGY
ncbi:MAG: COG4315 family predicted lipoprotein [Streptomyces sp.]|uniref:COG4315 family predicted lipoprotein n=1 Tax=Streptomyces sp. TaxID=1931 RepID=UPI003D6B47B0